MFHCFILIVLVPGLLTGKQGSNLFLEALERRANDCLHSEKLQRLIQWATDSTEGSSGDFAQVVKRLSAIVFARALVRVLALARDRELKLARARARALNRDRELNLILALAGEIARNLARDHDLARNLARELAQLFSRSNIFVSISFSALIEQLENLGASLLNTEDSEKQKQNFRKTVVRMCLDTLGISAGDVQLAADERVALNDYFYICELMVRCKESAVRVSPDVWAGIESRILTVPEQ